QLGAAAGLLAKEDADLGTLDPSRTGVVMGVALGPLSSIVYEFSRFEQGGAKAVSALMPIRTLPNANAAVLGGLLGIDGPCHSVAAGCASGALSIGEGAHLVASGRCDVVFAGASEAGMLAEPQGTLDFLEAGLGHLRVLSDEPVGRPFDRDRRGFIAAEGAAVVVLEAAERASARGARTYGTVDGCGTALDHDLVAPATDGVAIATAMRRAMLDAGLDHRQVVHVNAHGSGTLANDLAEANAIHLALGEPGPPVVSTKGTTGHSGAASGSVEAVALLLSLFHGVLPPVHGLREPDPDLRLDVVRAATPWEPGPSLSLSLGLGG
ncbi:hypothetical protein B7486_62400, partial [cyanobacterium TDX16]